MNVRGELDRHFRRVRTLFLTGVAVLAGSICFFMAVISAHRHRPLPGWLSYTTVASFSVSVVLFGLSSIYACLTIRCHYCGCRLTSLVHPRLDIAHFRYCPGCGRSLDGGSPEKNDAATLPAKGVPWDEELL